MRQSTGVPLISGARMYIFTRVESDKILLLQNAAGIMQRTILVTVRGRSSVGFCSMDQRNTGIPL